MGLTFSVYGGHRAFACQNAASSSGKPRERIQNMPADAAVAKSAQAQERAKCGDENDYTCRHCRTTPT